MKAAPWRSAATTGCDAELAGQLVHAGQRIAQRALPDGLAQSSRGLIRDAGAEEVGKESGFIQGNKLDYLSVNKTAGQAF